MFSLSCPNCKADITVNDVLRCPFCGKDISKMTDELNLKHVFKCSAYVNPYKYSKRKRGRPSNDDLRKFWEERIQ